MLHLRKYLALSASKLKCILSCYRLKVRCLEQAFDKTFKINKFDQKAANDKMPAFCPIFSFQNSKNNKDLFNRFL